jgi:molybdopterin-guanine dinucleotide biosynthesis protein A
MDNRFSTDEDGICVLMDIGAVILAGGTNSRFGVNKAFLEIDGRPIIERTLDILTVLFHERLIVTNSPSEYAESGSTCSIITDMVKGAGPLGGIYSALAAAESDACFIVACDMPFLAVSLIRDQCGFFNQHQYDACIPAIGSYIEPLHGIYRKVLSADMRLFLTTHPNASIREFLSKIHVGYYRPGESSKIRMAFTNINTQEDLDRLMETKGQGHLY